MMNCLKIQILTFGIHLKNLFVNIPFDDWFSCRFIRPLTVRLLGGRCGNHTVLRKGIFYGNLKNITIGNRCNLNREIFLDAFDKITIGNNVLIAFRVNMITSSHLTDDDGKVGNVFGKPITIKDNVWIGAGAIIGPGITIGENTVVSAGSVVLRDVPANSTVAGNPARAIKLKNVTNEN